MDIGAVTIEEQLRFKWLTGRFSWVGACHRCLPPFDERDGIQIDVRNPECDDDCFTDRWPENRGAQRMYIDDLKLLRGQLAALMSDELMLDEKRDLLVAMFGEGPAQSAIDDYAAMIGRAVQSGQRTVTSTGKVVPIGGVAAPLITSSASAQARGHTFYGTRWKPR